MKEVVKHHQAVHNAPGLMLTVPAMLIGIPIGIVIGTPVALKLMSRLVKDALAV